MNRLLKYFAIGLAGGGVGGLMGVGGGIIMIPLLTSLGLAQKKAQGTSLSAVIPLAIMSLVVYASNGNVDIAASIPLAIGGMAGAFAGVALMKRFTNEVMFKLFGVVLVLVAARHFFSAMTPDANGMELPFIVVVLVGMFAGIISGFFGLGGGIIFVPSGVQLLGLGEKIARGASLTAIIPTASIGFFKYLTGGEIEKPACFPIAVGAVAGSLASSLAANRIGDHILGMAFAILLAIVGIRRLLSKTGGSGTTTDESASA